MDDWPTIEIMFAILMMTSFTCVGLLALWAANSSQHWFVRVALVLGVLSPFLIVPADELFLSALLASGIVCLATFGRRVYQRRTESTSGINAIAKSLPKRFSLATTLLSTAVLAILIVILTRVRISTLQLIYASLGGICLGIAIYSASLVCSGGYKIWQRVGPALIMVQMLFFILAVNGAVFATFTDVWSTSWTEAATSGLSYSAIGAIIAAVVLCVGITLLDRALLLGLVGKNAVPTLAGKSSLTIRILSAVYVAVVAALPIILLWELLHPLPMPADSVPVPNGHQRLVELGMRLENSAVVREYNADPINYDKLEKAVAQQLADYAEIREAIAMPGWIPVDYDVDVFFADMNQLTGPRQILRALAARSMIARRNGDMDDVTALYIDMLRLGEALQRGGLAINYLVASACEFTAHEELYEALPEMNAHGCAMLSKEIASYDARRRDIEEVLYRERAWIQRAYGWTGHLAEILGRIARKDDSFWEPVEVRSVHHRNQAVTRLLLLELAIRHHQLQHQRFPTNLDALIPDFIIEIPIDPFHPLQHSLQYKLTENGYLLYSVGLDGDDDGGRPPAEDEYSWSNWGGTGDLLLEYYFASSNEDDSSSAATGTADLTSDEDSE